MKQDFGFEVNLDFEVSVKSDFGYWKPDNISDTLIANRFGKVTTTKGHQRRRNCGEFVYQSGGVAAASSCKCCGDGRRLYELHIRGQIQNGLAHHSGLRGKEETVLLKKHPLERNEFTVIWLLVEK